MLESELTHQSYDGKTQIHALLWEPAAGLSSSTAEAADGGGAVCTSNVAVNAKTVAPKGVVQIAHGMAEHIARYRDFATFLTSNGYVVCGNDHIGHGRSVATPDDWGNLPLANGKDILIEDVHQLRSLIATRYPNTPYFLFGHSMGSFIVRSYCTRYASGLAGAVICGTGQLAPLLSAVGTRIAHVIARFRGETYKSKLLEGMGVGAYAKQIPDARTSFDWLSFNEQNVDDYIADPACGYTFSVGGDAALTALTGEIAKPSSAAAIPQGLPLFFIAGKEDPVGDKGKGVLAVVEQMRQTGHEQVEFKLYENMRHEILNETDRALVYRDVLDWLKERVMTNRQVTALGTSTVFEPYADTEKA